jgi:hypothetical protein
MSLFGFLSTRQYRWLALLWTGGIIVACSLPATSLSSVQPALSADKAIHFFLFAGFGLLWMRVLCPPSAATASRLRRYGIHLLGWGSLFAVGTEVYQHLLPIQRTGDPYDALADGGGLLAAVLLYAVLVRSSLVSEGASTAPSQDA